MNRLLVVSLIACGSSDTLARPHDPTPRERAVAQLVALAALPDLDSASVARVLETTSQKSSCEQYRCDGALAATELFGDIRISSGTGWCTVRLAPTALALQDLVPAVLDARYASEPIVVHRQGGIEIAGVTQHFALGSREIVATIASGGTMRAAIESSIDQVSVDTRRDAIQTIDVTCTSRMPANAPTLRAFRHWAATHP